MNNFERVMERVNEKTLIVGVIGLGYVGLPLAVTFAKKGVSVIGFEKSESRAAQVNRAENYIGDVKDEDLTEVIGNKTLKASTNLSKIKECDAVFICVPTPLDRFKKPDMSYIEGSCTDIGKNMSSGTLISLESTTYPTTTEELMKPILEKESGLKEGEDFWMCYSPERVDPGNLSFKTANTPKVLGAIGKEALDVSMAIYGLAIENLHPVSSPRAAEMVKILENTYRLVNISLINELALLAGKMDINIWEVIEAAATKPFGFQAFYPGPGIGGHCIPLDPFYLEYIAKGMNFDLSMIDSAGRINNIMPHRMMSKVAFALNRHEKPIKGSKILFMGVAYKPNIDDSRESPALLLMEEVARKGGVVSYHDPYIPEVKDDHGNSYTGVELTDEVISSADCVVFTTNHSVFDVDYIVDKAKLVVDTRNAVKRVHIEDAKVFKL